MATCAVTIGPRKNDVFPVTLRRSPAHTINGSMLTPDKLMLIKWSFTDSFGLADKLCGFDPVQGESACRIRATCCVWRSHYTRIACFTIKRKDSSKHVKNTALYAHTMWTRYSQCIQWSVINAIKIWDLMAVFWLASQEHPESLRRTRASWRRTRVYSNHLYFLQDGAKVLSASHAATLSGMQQLLSLQTCDQCMRADLWRDQ